jgi:hypothetical protein
VFDSSIRRINNRRDILPPFDESRKRIGRIMWTHAASRETPWFWTITARVPQQSSNRGYAVTRADAMAAFKAAWGV